MDEELMWNIIDKYFNDNPDILVEHHIESYNDFFKNGIYKIFKENNPIYIQSNYDESIDDYRNQCLIYMGGKDGNKIHFGKPIIYDDNDNVHFMYPNEARLRNMTYGMTIHYDVDIEFIDILGEDEPPSYIANEAIDEENEREEDYPMKKKFVNFKETDTDLEEVKGGARKLKRKKRNHKPYNMTTGMTSEMREALEESMIEENKQLRKHSFKNVYLGKFPIMLQSDFCILRNLPGDLRFTMGECKHDKGGYFIIQGKEKTVIPQEKFADNVLYIKKKKILDNEEDDIEIKVQEYAYSVEIKSVSENVSKPIRRLFVTIAEEGDMGLANYSNKNILVSIPNVRKPVPLFIVFRALGIISDKSIIEMCLLDMEKYEHMIDLFIPSVHDAGGILTQKLAIEYISFLVKGTKTDHVMEILSDYLLPHVGETNYYEKAHYLGYMVFRLLCVYSGLETPTDRDSFSYKRIETSGSLISDLFSEYYAIQRKYIRQQYDKILTLNKNQYSHDLYSLFETNKNYIFGKRDLEEGFRKAFKGNWGSKENTKRIGVLQDLNRLSFNGYLSHMRKTNLPFDSSNKNPEPRHLHGSQWGFIDPLDTPDGGNIGLHKHLSISSHITVGSLSRDKIINWLREKITMRLLNESSPKVISNMTKIFVNGFWAGCVYDPIECVDKIKAYRRNALLPIYLSINFDIPLNTIFIYCDSGRICRPIFYRDNDKLSITNSKIMEKIKKDQFSWEELTTGFNEKKNELYTKNHNQIFELGDLYEGLKDETNIKKVDKLDVFKAPIDYIDSNETENALICMDYEEFDNKKYTHMEIDKSLILGILSNQVPFPETNQAPRNMFSCGQTKQATSIYSSNYLNRMDKSAIVLNTGQIPLVKTRYFKYLHNEELPYGENLIVAIMCYGGYNMEDSILINEGSIKRGMFTTTYYNTYETHEEINEKGDIKSETLFGNIEKDFNIIGKKEDYDYTLLDEFGLINENTEINEKSILIGCYNKTQDQPNMDNSKAPKKGQLGIVDKSFITDDEEGKRIAKVRIREMRVPNLGDKMGSRVGQKGTVGLVIPEYDMPFTKNGLKPDLIINPHAIPSRMTVGQLVESITGKACLMKGGFGDCTAFVNKGSKVEIFGKMLTNNGYHSTGNDILYNGMTGEQIETEIFMGPTYYMRLKHMVKDKINYRARGPNAALTRQPVGGRANDGGLRIGEMERDTIISHGAVNFLTESMMERGDKYEMAVCNNSGMISIYNPNKNLFLSPVLDGPIVFEGSVEGDNLHIENISKFGRDFSVVKVPYSMKLLMQELMAINVQMRIITEANINQIENMTYSDNINKLANIDDINELRNVIKNKLGENKGDDFKYEPETPEESPPYEPETPDDSPPYKPETPEELKDVDMEIEPNEDSPDYAPERDEVKEAMNKTKPTNKVFNDFKEMLLKENPELNEEQIITAYRQFLKTGKIPKKEPIIKDERVIGGSVCLKSMPQTDSNNWVIKNITPEFYTLQRANKNNIDIEKDIKVVDKSDVYSPDEMVMSSLLPQQSMENYENPTFPEMDKKNMIFAPSITVLGNNNENISLPKPSITPQMVGEEMENNIVSVANEPIIVKSKDEKKDEKIENLSNVDFSKDLIIKKV